MKLGQAIGYNGMIDGVLQSRRWELLDGFRDGENVDADVATVGCHAHALGSAPEQSLPRGHAAEARQHAHAVCAFVGCKPPMA